MRRCKWLWLDLLLVVAVLLGGCNIITGRFSDTTATSAATYASVSVEQAYELIRRNESNDRFVILDVRTPSEYESGHIEGAVNIDINRGSFEEDMQKLDRDGTYLVYCRSGGRSRTASEIMVDNGFTHIFNMTGGITAWKNAGFPVVP